MYFTQVSYRICLLGKCLNSNRQLSNHFNGKQEQREQISNDASMQRKTNRFVVQQILCHIYA